MTSRRFGPCAMVALLCAAGSPPLVRAAVPGGCALEAGRALSVGNATTFEGDLVVTDAGGRARLGRNTLGSDGTTVVADTLRVGRGASVFDLVATIVRGGSDAVVRGARSSGSFPRPTSCAITPVVCGRETVRVDKGARRMLQPKAYGGLVVEDGAALVLAPGAYTFCSIHTGRHVLLSVEPDGPTSIAVTGDLVLGNATSLAPSSVSRPTVEVGGTRVELGAHSRVDAELRSPLARLSAGTATVLTGGACARTVDTGWHFALRCADGAPATTSSTTSSTTLTTASTSSTSTSVAPSTTTTVPATTSTTTSSSTSSSSSTSTMPAVETTTSTMPNLETTTSTTIEAPTTTSSSTTTSTTTTTSTSTTTHPPLCGNGVVNTGETCDDGNNSDNDSCPADCVIDACTPITTTSRFVSLQFAPPPGGLVAGLTVLLDYPEGKVDLPGNGTSFPSGTLSGAPPGSSVSVNDLNFNGKGHAVRVTIAGQNGTAIPPGQLVRFKFQDCMGATAPTADQFLCSVIAATDPFTNHVDGVRCFAVLP